MIRFGFISSRRFLWAHNSVLNYSADGRGISVKMPTQHTKNTILQHKEKLSVSEFALRQDPADWDFPSSHFRNISSPVLLHESLDVFWCSNRFTDATHLPPPLPWCCGIGFPFLFCGWIETEKWNFYSVPKKKRIPRHFPRRTLSYPIIENLIIATRRHQDECLCGERKGGGSGSVEKLKRKKTSWFLQWTTSFRRVSTDDDKVLPAKWFSSLPPLLTLRLEAGIITGLKAEQINSASWSLAVGISFNVLVVLRPSIATYGKRKKKCFHHSSHVRINVGGSGNNSDGRIRPDVICCRL